MIISRGRQFIFVHIPKTGGTSLALALEARAMKDDIMLGDTPKATRRRRRVRDVKSSGRLWKHAALRDIRGLVTDEEIASFKVFTMVRNPWDRIVSYYHWLRGQSFDHPAVQLAKASNFSSFLNHEQTRASLRAQPCESYVTNEAGALRCDLFLRLEHLDEDLPRLEELLDLRIAPLPHVNRSEREEGYRAHYSAADRALVEELAAPDIARFGYTFTTSCK
ncbi:MAG: sulfotransferase family 2 domain-containing protein [Litoreibacter sp.]|nr:sulfotransferase family 2 domain-containing protein [Litoreibacter sp.]